MEAPSKPNHQPPKNRRITINYPPFFPTHKFHLQFLPSSTPLNSTPPPAKNQQKHRLNISTYPPAPLYSSDFFTNFQAAPEIFIRFLG